MNKTEIAEIITEKINDELKHFDNNIPERYALAWKGYLAGLLEWNIIEPFEYGRLNDMLPDIQTPNPILEIFEGRDGDDE